MPSLNEIDTFRATWENEARNTIQLLEALPAGQYGPNREAMQALRARMQAAKA